MAKVVLLFLFYTTICCAVVKAPLTKFDSIIDDELHRIGPEFHIPNELRSSVEFWFNIYTRYDSRFLVIHNPSTYKIYEAVDTSKFPTRQRSQIIKNKLAEIKKKFNVNARTQTGQRNFIYDGFLRLRPYYKTIYFITLNFDLPSELMALAFLESSFNPKAESKAGAVGAWQIMPATGRQYFTVNTERDDRKNIFLSTLGAMWLLRNNYKYIKSWPFVITSYNSGFYHIIRARKKLRTKNLTFTQFINDYDHPRIGFASKNYYSEYLALVHTLAYKELFFPEIDFSDQDQELLKSKVRPKYKFFSNKCTTQLTSKENLQVNSHLNFSRNLIPKNQIFVFKQNPNPKYFEEIPWNIVFKKHPKNWIKKAKNYNCSTTYVE